MTGDERLRDIVQELGEFQTRMVFTGGLVLALYLERRPAFRIRPTDDADAVVACANYREYVQLQTDLGKVGVRPLDDDPDAPMCRMRTSRGHLLDLMPWNPAVLGCGNRFFRQGFEQAMTHSIGPELEIHIFTPPLYAASKAEAYRDRGYQDPWNSHDLEDLLTLIACRPSLVAQVAMLEEEVREYLSTFAHDLLGLPRIDELVSGHVGDMAEQAIVGLQGVADL